MNPAVPLLLLACAVYALVHLLRAGGGFRLKPALLGLAGLLVVGLALAGWWLPTGAGYLSAESNRVIRAAAETAQRDAAQADCVVVVDGSSVFTYALRTERLRDELTKAGLHPCVLSLVLTGGEHLEREWMARQLRESLPEQTRQRLDALPMLWVKELHWTYETHPARFVALNAFSPRTLAHCTPAMVWPLTRALHENWKSDCRSDNLHGTAAWKIYPWDQVTAVLRQGIYNLFHVGQLERLEDVDPGPLYHVLGEGPIPLMNSSKSWWKERPALDAQVNPSSTYRQRHWFERLLEAAPESWPHRPGFELVLATMPGQNGTVQEYGAALEAWGLPGGKRMLLGSRDPALRKQLDDPTLWRDHIHLEEAGAAVYTQWLAAKLSPLIREMKNPRPTPEAGR